MDKIVKEEKNGEIRKVVFICLDDCNLIQITTPEHIKPKRVVKSKFGQLRTTARKHVLLKRAEFEEEPESSLETKVYELFDTINTIIKQKTEDNWQEADSIGRIKRLLQIVFLGSLLKITAAATTKPVIEYNQGTYTGSISSVFASSPSSFPLASSSIRKSNYNGRKVDLKVTGNNDQELSFWEFKTNDASQIALQESKTLRLAQCLQKSLKSLFSVENDLVRYRLSTLRTKWLLCDKERRQHPCT
ncbi:hypothetical protein EDC96DRAFT_265880 [Choanephora cucurbitarum]|nr:hypothetical protein EDC96DRAFT_265880 [Choanephora cucurbitarum]